MTTLKKRRILVLCPYPEGEAAGQRLKYEQYFSFWKEEGYEIVISSYMNKNMWKVLYKKGFFVRKILGVIRGNILRLLDLFRARKFDVIYIHQWTTPFGSILFDKLLRLISKNIIFDLEDFVFLDGVDSGLSVNPILKLLRSKKRTTNLIKFSDYVLTSSPDLNEYCKSLNIYNRSIFISSSIDVDRFKPKIQTEKKKKITIGWTGTQSSKPYLDLLNQTLLDLKKEREFELLIISNFDYKFSGLDLKVIKWNKGTEIEDLQKIDIGLYPLEQNDWVLGKSGLKALQYMAIGVPVVATDIGTSKDIISHMENGLLVSTSREWVSALKTLMDNEALRRRIGKEARQVIIERYSLNAIKEKYFLVLNSLNLENP